MNLISAVGTDVTCDSAALLPGFLQGLSTGSYILLLGKDDGIRISKNVGWSIHVLRQPFASRC